MIEVRARVTARLRRVGTCAGWVAASACLPAHAASTPASLGFDRTFSDAAEPASLHYEVTYVAAGIKHRLEVWREGQRRLRRRTDNTIDTFVTRSAADGEFTMTIVDNAKRLSTRIDRSNLYRLGNFTDWFDLAHGLKHPMAVYQLQRSDAPEAAPVPVAPCHWYRLVQSGRATQLCWSELERLPLIIEDDDGQVRWTVTFVAQGPLPEHVFEIHDAGYVRNDANQDMERD